MSLLDTLSPTQEQLDAAARQRGGRSRLVLQDDQPERKRDTRTYASRRIYRLENYRRNRSRHLERARRWRLLNREHIRIYMRDYMRSWRAGKRMVAA